MCVLVEQEFDTFWVFCGDDEAHMMALLHAPDNLGIVVCRSIRIFLTGQPHDDACIILLMLWELVRASLWCGFNSGPLAPEVNACGCLDQIHDIGPTDTGSRFEKVEMAIVASFNEFHVGDAAHHTEGSDNLLAKLLQRLLILRPARKGACGGDATLMKYV